MSQDLTLKDYYHIFKKNKWLIGGFTFVISVVAIVISLLLPLWYAGTAQIVRPQSQVLDMSSLQVKTMSFMGSTDGPTNRYLAILNSRSLKESVCKKYNLVEAYDTKGMDKAVKKFSENYYNVDLGDENQIIVTVFDRDQERVADMTNYVVFLLDSINMSLSKQYGKEERSFIEGQLESILDSLSILENDLLKFMNDRNVISVEEQLTAEVEFATELKYQIQIKETELKVMETTGKPAVTLEPNRIALNNMEKQYNELFKPGNDLFIDLSEAPEISLYLNQIERKIEYFNQVLIYLGPLYEQSKITEAKDVPTFEVLDYAHRPDRKAKPKRAIIVVSAFMFALLSSGVYVLLKETQE